MSTSIVVAIAVVALILIAVAVLVVLPRLRGGAERRRELEQRRDEVAAHHETHAEQRAGRADELAAEAEQRRREAEAAARRAEAERAEADLHAHRAELHRSGEVSEDELRREHERLRGGGTNGDGDEHTGRRHDDDPLAREGRFDRDPDLDEHDRPARTPDRDLRLP